MNSLPLLSEHLHTFLHQSRNALSAADADEIPQEACLEQGVLNAKTVQAKPLL
jgi:hypothetical protein